MNQKQDMNNDMRFHPMSDVCYSRMAQIPIRNSRFQYLTHSYVPENNDYWVLLHEPGHFRIYDKSTGFCLFDAEYCMLTKHEEEEDSLVAAIFKT